MKIERLKSNFNKYFLEKRINIIVISLISFFIGFNLIFIYFDDRIISSDEIYYLGELNPELLKSDISVTQAVVSTIKNASYYPNVLPSIYIVMWKLFGFSRDYAILLIQFFYFILLLSTYHIGKLVKSPAAGTIALFIVGTSTSIITYSRQLLLDMPVIALSNLTLLFLLRKVSNKNLFLLGLFIGLSLLIKQTPILFIVIPFIIYIANLKQKDKAFIPIITTLSLVSFYYFRMNNFYIQTASSLQVIGRYSSLINMKFFNLLDYIFLDGIRQLYYVSVGKIYFWIFLFSLIFFIVKYKKSKRYLIILTWIIIPYLILSIIPLQGFYSYQSAIPILGVLSGYLIVELPKMKYKYLTVTSYLLIIVIILYGIINPLFFFYDETFHELPKLYTRNKLLRSLYSNKFLVSKDIFIRDYFRFVDDYSMFSFYKPLKFENMNNTLSYFSHLNKRFPSKNNIFFYGTIEYAANFIEFYLRKNNITNYNFIEHFDVYDCIFPNASNIIITFTNNVSERYLKCGNLRTNNISVQPIYKLPNNLTFYVYETG